MVKTCLSVLAAFIWAAANAQQTETARVAVIKGLEDRADLDVAERVAEKDRSPKVRRPMKQEVCLLQKSAAGLSRSPPLTPDVYMMAAEDDGRRPVINVESLEEASKWFDGGSSDLQPQASNLQLVHESAVLSAIQASSDSVAAFGRDASFVDETAEASENRVTLETRRVYDAAVAAEKAWTKARAADEKAAKFATLKAAEAREAQMALLHVLHVEPSSTTAVPSQISSVATTSAEAGPKTTSGNVTEVQTKCGGKGQMPCTPFLQVLTFGYNTAAWRGFVDWLGVISIIACWTSYRFCMQKCWAFFFGACGTLLLLLGLIGGTTSGISPV